MNQRFSSKGFSSERRGSVWGRKNFNGIPSGFLFIEGESWLLQIAFNKLDSVEHPGKPSPVVWIGGSGICPWFLKMGNGKPPRNHQTTNPNHQSGEGEWSKVRSSPEGHHRLFPHPPKTPFDGKFVTYEHIPFTLSAAFHIPQNAYHRMHTT